MKRLILFILLNLFVLCSLAQDKMYPEGLSIPNTEYYKEMSKNPDFIAVYKEAIKLNKDRFSDINLIQIGDTIYFPNLNEVGIEKIIIKKTDTKNGVDCIWNISKKSTMNLLTKKNLKKLMNLNKMFYSI